MKRNVLFIILILIIFLTVIGILILSNNVEIAKNIMKKNKAEEIKLFSYEIIDDTDEENMKVVIYLNSEVGIEYIENPEGTRIYGNGKKNLALDYSSKSKEEKIFKIKEIGREEETKTLTAILYKITISETDIELIRGRTIQLSATINPEVEETVKWESLDTTIATIDENGLIKGIDTGKTKIKASYENGIAYCDIEVIDQYALNYRTKDKFNYTLSASSTYYGRGVDRIFDGNIEAPNGEWHSSSFDTPWVQIQFDRPYKAKRFTITNRVTTGAVYNLSTFYIQAKNPEDANWTILGEYSQESGSGKVCKHEIPNNYNDNQFTIYRIQSKYYISGYSTIGELEIEFY